MQWIHIEEWRYSSTIHDLGTRWRLVISFTPRKAYPPSRPWKEPILSITLSVVAWSQLISRTEVETWPRYSWQPLMRYCTNGFWPRNNARRSTRFIGHVSHSTTSQLSPRVFHNVLILHPTCLLLRSTVLWPGRSEEFRTSFQTLNAH
jgi:hypothetical protein